jgi:hypothetical protein
MAFVDYRRIIYHGDSDAAKTYACRFRNVLNNSQKSISRCFHKRAVPSSVDKNLNREWEKDALIKQQHFDLFAHGGIWKVICAVKLNIEMSLSLVGQRDPSTEALAAYYGVNTR